MNRTVVALIEAEYRRYRILGERAFRQLDAEQLVTGSEHASSIATIVWHVAGNLESRFTDFLTTDGRSRGATASRSSRRATSRRPT